MASLNAVTPLGHLTREPERRYTPQGTAAATFGLAVNRRYRQDEGQREDVCFIDIVTFGRQAETASEYLSKGSAALIEGRLQWRSWETPEGQKRSKHEVVATNVQFIPRSQSEPNEEVDQSARPAAQSTANSAPPSPSRMGDRSHFDDSLPPPGDDGIPF